MSLEKTNVREGLLGSRKTAAALACVLALAMVVCAFAVTAPSDDVDGTTVIIDNLAETDVKTIQEGMTLGVGIYIVDGNYNVKVQSTIADTSDLTTPFIDKTTTPRAPVLVLLGGASVTLQGAGTDPVFVFAATNFNAFDSEKYINFTGKAVDGVISYEATVTMTAEKAASNAYVSSEMGLTVDGTIGTNVIVTIQDGTPIKAAGTIESTGTGIVKNLGFAYATKTLVSGSTYDYVYFSAITAAGIPVLKDDATSYVIGTEATDAVVSAEYGTDKIVSVEINAASNVAVGYSGTYGLTIAPTVSTENNNVYEVISGALTISSSTDLTGIDYIVKSSATNGASTITYYAANAIPAEGFVLGTDTYTVMNGASSTIVFRSSAEANAVTATFTGVSGVDTDDKTTNGATIKMNSDKIEIGGVVAAGKITYTGDLTSTVDISKFVDFAYSKAVTGQTTTYTYYLNAPASVTDAGTYTIRDSGDSSVTFGETNTFTLAGVKSADGLKIVIAAENANTISGDIDAGTITVSGEGAAITAADTLTIADGAKLVMSDGSRIAATSGTTIDNQGSITLAANSTSATINLDGTYKGTVPEGVGLNIASITAVSGAVWNYAEFKNSTYTLYDEMPSGSLTIADGNEYIVKNATGGSITVVIDNSKNVVFADGFTSEEGVTVSSAGIDSGTYNGGMTVNGADITSLTVGTEEEAAVGTTPAVPAGEATLAIVGTVSATTLVINEGGTVTIAQGNTLSPNSRFTNHGTIDLDGTISFTSKNLSSDGKVLLSETSTISLGGNNLVGTDAISLGSNGTATVTKVTSGGGFELTVETGENVTVAGSYDEIGDGTSITIEQGVKVTVNSTTFNVEGKLINNGEVIVNKALTVDSDTSGTVTNNGTMQIVGSVAGAVVNNGEIIIASIDAASGATVTGENPYFEGTGWQYTPGTTDKLAIVGNVEDVTFTLARNTDVEVAGNYTMSVEGANAFVIGNNTLTFVNPEGEDNTLTIDAQETQTVTTVYAVYADDTGTLNINADVVANAGISVPTIVIGTAEISVDVTVDGAITSSTKLEVVNSYVDVNGGITSTGSEDNAGLIVTDSGIVSVGAITYKKITLDGANISITLPEDATGYGFQVNENYTDNSTGAAASSIITEGLEYYNVDTTKTGNTMFIVNGGAVKYTIGTDDNEPSVAPADYIVVEGGLASAPEAGYVYLYNGAQRIGSNILTNAVTGGIADGANVYNILALALADDGSNVVFVSASSVNLAGLQIDKDMTIATGAHGAVIVDEGVTLTIGGDYTGADATVNGTLAVVGSTNGTVNKIVISNVTGIVYTDGTIGLADGAKALAQGTVKDGEETVIVANIEIPAGTTITFLNGTVIKEVAINGASALTITVMAENGLKVAVPAEEAPTGESTPATPAGALRAAAYADTTADEQEDAPVFTMTGDIQLDASQELGGIGIADATITSGANAPEGGYGITITADGKLYLSGTINLDGATITVPNGTQLVIAKDAVINGDEGSIILQQGGDIVNNGGTVSSGMVVTDENYIPEVGTPEAFLAALPYYGTIEVVDDIPLESEEAVTYNATNVDIILNGGVITIGKNVTLVFTEANVSIADTTNAAGQTVKAEGGITVKGTETTNADGTKTVEKGYIQVNNSDIYVDVVVDEDLGEVLEGTGNTMNVSGTSTGLGQIGFGNTLVIDDAFTLGNRTGDLLVYGTVQVNSGVTLTISQGTTLTVSKSGVLNVDGTVANAGNIVVNGTADIVGAVTVAEKGALSGSGTVNVTGTLDINGTVVTNIVDKGTVTINGTVSVGQDTPATTDDISTVVTIYDGATLNIEKATGKMTVTDAGTVADYKTDNEKITFNPAQDGNTVTMTDAVGYVISTETASKTVTVKDTDGKDAKVTYDYAVLSVSGAGLEGTVVIDPATGLNLGSMQIAKGSVTIEPLEPVAGIKDEEQNTTITVPADVTITVAVGAQFVNNAELTVEGSVAVSAATAAKIGGVGAVNATYYDESTAAAGDVAAYVTKTYTTFDSAIGAIAGADKTTVTVIGEQTAAATADVTGTVVVSNGAELTIGEGVTLTFTAQGYMLNGNTADKKVIVEGTLVFANYPNYSEGTTATTTAVASPMIDADVAIIETPARTFTTLANAIAMGETDITLNQDVVLTESMEIPAGVTVKGDDKDITIGENDSEKDITLTVKGAVQLTGDGIIKQVTGAEIENSDPADNYEGTLVVDGMGYVYTEAIYNGIDNVAGAHYVKTIEVPATTTTAADEYDAYVVSTVDYAAGDSAHVKVVNNVADIEIVGDAKATDVTFTVPASEDEGVTYTMVITLAEKAALTAGSVTVAPGVTIDGTYGTITGSVVYTDVGTVDLNKVVGAEIQSMAATTGTNATPAMLTIAGSVTGDVAVSAGTVTVKGTLKAQNPADERSSSSLTVTADATLDVDGTVTTQDKVPVTVNGTMDVAGTVTVNGKATVAGTVTVKGTVNFYGETTVNGEIAVEGAEAATSTETDDIAILAITNGNIAGTIDANEYSYITVYAVVTGTVNADGTVLINAVLGDLGEGSYELGTALTGEVAIGENATVTAAAIKAYYGTTVSGLGDDVKSTAYVINGKTYVTVYFLNVSAVSIMDVVYTEEFDLTENGLALDTGLNYNTDAGVSDKNTGLYNPANWYKTSNMLPNTILTGNEMIGSSATVYAQVEPVPVTVTVTVGEGITMYIDGIPYISGSYDLTVGPHEVLLQAQAGFTVEKATVTLYKGTEATTVGDSFTLNAGDENVKIVALGAEQTSGDITVNVPDSGTQEPPVVNVTTGDNEMSLTDYLLIVLVVLIVIMAIIVALRLMRN